MRPPGRAQCPALGGRAEAVAAGAPTGQRVQPPPALIVACSGYLQLTAREGCCIVSGGEGRGCSRLLPRGHTRADTQRPMRRPSVPLVVVTHTPRGFSSWGAAQWGFAPIGLVVYASGEHPSRSCPRFPRRCLVRPNPPFAGMVRLYRARRMRGGAPACYVGALVLLHGVPPG